MSRIRPNMSRRKVRACNALGFRARYLIQFEEAHRAGNIEAAHRAARKAQYWQDRYDILTASDLDS